MAVDSLGAGFLGDNLGLVLLGGVPVGRSYRAGPRIGAGPHGRLALGSGVQGSHALLETIDGLRVGSLATDDAYGLGGLERLGDGDDIETGSAAGEELQSIVYRTAGSSCDGEKKEEDDIVDGVAVEVGLHAVADFAGDSLGETGEVFRQRMKASRA